MYGTIEKADAYMAIHDLHDTWTTYTPALKTKAIKKATSQIDSLRLAGRKCTTTQDLEFPRFRLDQVTRVLDILSYIDDEIPTDVEETAYIQAKFLLDTRNNCVIQALNSGVTQITIGKTSQTIDKDLLPVDLNSGLSTEAYNKIKKYLVSAI